MINEKDYLAANPDVAEALRAGVIRNAFEHYIFHGRAEGRKRAPDEGNEKKEGREARKPEPPAAS